MTKKVILLGGPRSEEVHELSDYLYKQEVVGIAPPTKIRVNFLQDDPTDSTMLVRPSYYRKHEITFWADNIKFEFWVYDNVPYPQSYELIGQFLHRIYDRYINDFGKK